MNQMMNSLRGMLGQGMNSPEKQQVLSNLAGLRVPPYEEDLHHMKEGFELVLKEIKKGIGNNLKPAMVMTDEMVKEMYLGLTKGQDIQKLSISPEQIAELLTQQILNTIPTEALTNEKRMEVEQAIHVLMSVCGNIN